MSNVAYIHDQKGNRIAMMDGFGNLTEEAMMLYAEGKLSATDKAAIDTFAGNDEMSRDALDGLLMVQSGRRLAVTELKATVAERTGTALFTSGGSSNLPIYRIAAGVALLVAVGAGTYFASRYIQESRIAANETVVQDPDIIIKPTPVIQPPVEQVMDTLVAEVDSVATIEVAEPPVAAPTALSKAEVKLAADANAKAGTSPLTAAELAQQAKDKAKESAAKSAKKAEETAKKEEQKLLLADEKPKSKEPEPEIAAASSADRDDSEDVEVRVQSLAQEQTKETSSKKKGRKEEAEAPASASRNAAKREDAAKKAEQERSTSQEFAYAEQKAAKQAGAASGNVQPIAYDLVQTPPRFPGGDLEMMRFINRNRNYPETLKNEGVTGSVYVNFTVQPDGKVTDINVTKGVNPVLDEDAKRVLRAMPKWSPAEQDGQKVSTSRTLMIKYE